MAATSQRRRNVFLTHPTDHEDGNRERPVPDTQHLSGQRAPPERPGTIRPTPIATAVAATPVRHQASHVRSAASQVR